MPDASAEPYAGQDVMRTVMKRQGCCPEGGGTVDFFSNGAGDTVYIECAYRHGTACDKLSNGHAVACFQYRNPRITNLFA
jgi:hypothetical protein